MLWCKKPTIKFLCNCYILTKVKVTKLVLLVCLISFAKENRESDCSTSRTRYRVVAAAHCSDLLVCLFACLCFGVGLSDCATFSLLLVHAARSAATTAVVGCLIVPRLRLVGTSRRPWQKVSALFKPPHLTQWRRTSKRRLTAAVQWWLRFPGGRTNTHDKEISRSWEQYCVT